MNKAVSLRILSGVNEEEFSLTYGLTLLDDKWPGQNIQVPKAARQDVAATKNVHATCPCDKERSLLYE